VACARLCLFGLQHVSHITHFLFGKHRRRIVASSLWLQQTTAISIKEAAILQYYPLDITMNVKMLHLILSTGTVFLVVYIFLEFEILSTYKGARIHEREKDVARSPPKISPLELEISPNKKRQQAHSLSRPANTSDPYYCLRPECIEEEAYLIARAFPDRSNKTWLVTSKKILDDTFMHHGIMMVKVPKAASSTLAGVSLRISRLHGNVPVEFEHKLPSKFSFGDRHPSESFLFATVRDPASRTLSEMFFEASRGTIIQLKNESNVLEYLVKSDDRGLGVSDGRGGKQLRWVSLYDIPRQSSWTKKSPTQVLNPRLVKSNVKNAVDNYDFLLVVERLDESLVAMALTMGLDIGDILVSSSKVAGSSYYYAPLGGGISPGRIRKSLDRGDPKSSPAYWREGANTTNDPAQRRTSGLVKMRVDGTLPAQRREKERDMRANGRDKLRFEKLRFVGASTHRPTAKCVKLERPFRTRAIDEYLESDEWRAMNYGDYLLHAAANRSLDLTIERIGRDRFDTALKEYQRLRTKADRVCKDHVQLPCSSYGKSQLMISQKSCYKRDFGCGHSCIDEMLLNETLGGKD
jgi:hypothetical protein